MQPQAPTPSPFTNWPDTLIDPARFRDEQARLARVWTFLGFTHDVTRDGDWFRATIATRSVFVQRLGDELRGFENRCAHRSFPLRNADKGNGPMVCGFHHWRYDKNGEAVDVPLCGALFGAAPGELAARLNRIEIDSCGSMIFGRFAAPGGGPSLRLFLGEAFDILAAMSDTPAAPKFVTRPVEANWRLCFHANVEDYHGPVIHARTLGKSGYPRLDRAHYFRFGWHSAFISNPDPDGLTRMTADCREGTWRSANYRVFQVFPDLTISHVRVHWENWCIVVVQYAPVSPSRSMMRAWYYRAPFPPRVSPVWYDLATRPLTNLVRKIAMPYLVKMVLDEDNAVCERQQSIAQRHERHARERCVIAQHQVIARSRRALDGDRPRRRPIAPP